MSRKHTSDVDVDKLLVSSDSIGNDDSCGDFSEVDSLSEDASIGAVYAEDARAEKLGSA